MYTNTSKSTPKTMRFSNDVLSYIENFEGKDFTDKFHNLVRYFMTYESEKKAILESLDAEIVERQKRLYQLSQILYNVRWVEEKFKTLDKAISDARDILSRFIDPNIDK